ncbi:MAG: hypothetical protein J6T04_03565 [Bacteroidales bacterium]|nr:hypothetical protein [Bacteroidales bacterium]
MTYKEIENKNLRDLKDEKQIVALHETGHLIAMMALGLYDKFEYITIEPANGTSGLTEMTPDAKAAIQKSLNRVAEKAATVSQKAAQMINYSDDYQAFCNLLCAGAPKLFLPHITRLFAGGSICRYYGKQRDDLCLIDNSLIRNILALYNMGDKFSEIQAVADAFLKLVFERYEKVIKLICYNLLERKTLNKQDIDNLLAQNKDDIFKW